MHLLNFYVFSQLENLKAKHEVSTFLNFFFFGTLGCWWLKIVVSIKFDYSFLLKFIDFPVVGKDSYDYNQNSPIKDFIKIFSLVFIWLSSLKLKD
jgi:hypothetical protein